MPTFLFLSNNCEYSHHFVNLMKKYWKHNDIEFVMIDKLDPVPEYITCTPSILLVDDETNDSILYQGQDAFDWLYKSVVDLYSSANIGKVRNKKKTEHEIDEEIDKVPPNMNFSSSSIKNKANINLQDNRKFDGTQDVEKLFQEMSSNYEG